MHVVQAALLLALNLLPVWAGQHCPACRARPRCLGLLKLSMFALLACGPSWDTARSDAQPPIDEGEHGAVSAVLRSATHLLSQVCGTGNHTPAALPALLPLALPAHAGSGWL